MLVYRSMTNVTIYYDGGGRGGGFSIEGENTPKDFSTLSETTKF